MTAPTSVVIRTTQPTAITSHIPAALSPPSHHGKPSVPLINPKATANETTTPVNQARNPKTLLRSPIFFAIYVPPFNLII